jgi:hypothetical protein
MLYKEFASTPKAPKPPTPEQSRIKSLQARVEQDRRQLSAERERQRKARDADRLKQLQTKLIN